MMVRDSYPAGVPCWIDVVTPDPDASARFFAALFGWTVGPRGDALVAQLDGHDVAGVIAADADPGWLTSVAVDDVGAVARAVTEHGGRVLDGPARFADPSGAVFGARDRRSGTGAQLVNRAGTWNWSNLLTPDAQRAEQFYAAVFGWQARRVDFGDGQGTMWCVPGYGDHLAERDPDLRRRHAEPGVPEGFSDAVAWLLPDEGPARWNVTLAVDDTDAIARRAEQLGGAVSLAPFDAGPVRVAQLRDPHGVAFEVNAYQPG